METKTIEDAIEELKEWACSYLGATDKLEADRASKELKRIITSIADQSKREERERIEAILKQWIPTDPMGYGVNLPSKGMHLDDHKRNFAKDILQKITT